MYHFLKNGELVKIKIMDFEGLEGICAKQTIKTGSPYHELNGFSYFCPGTIISEINAQSDTSVPVYANELLLTPFELQEKKYQLNKGYHKAIVATNQDELVGVIFCPWIKTDGSWHYRLEFIDVRKDFRNIGLAGFLYDALDNANFLSGKILQRTRYSEEGMKFLPSVTQRLKARQYALVHEDNMPKFIPSLPGKYP